MDLRNESIAEYKGQFLDSALDTPARNPRTLPWRLNRIQEFPRSFTPASKHTAFRGPKDLLELAKFKAKQDRRSLSNFLIVLLEKELEGMELPKPTKPVRRTSSVKKAR